MDGESDGFVVGISDALAGILVGPAMDGCWDDEGWFVTGFTDGVDEARSVGLVDGVDEESTVGWVDGDDDCLSVGADDGQAWSCV